MKQEEFHILYAVLGHSTKYQTLYSVSNKHMLPTFLLQHTLHNLTAYVSEVTTGISRAPELL